MNWIGIKTGKGSSIMSAWWASTVLEEKHITAWRKTILEIYYQGKISITVCSWLFTRNMLLRAGDEINPPDGDAYEVYRILFDLTFFFFVIVILLAIIQGESLPNCFHVASDYSKG